MRAYDRKKFYRQFCARQLRKGLTADPQSGNWGKNACPTTTAHNLQQGAHVNKRRSGD